MSYKNIFTKTIKADSLQARLYLSNVRSAIEENGHHVSTVVMQRVNEKNFDIEIEFQSIAPLDSISFIPDYEEL